MTYFYYNSKAEKVINVNDFDDKFKSVYTAVISYTKKSLGKGSDWIINSVTDYDISIYNIII